MPTYADLRHSSAIGAGFHLVLLPSPRPLISPTPVLARLRPPQLPLDDSFQPVRRWDPARSVSRHAGANPAATSNPLCCRGGRSSVVASLITMSRLGVARLILRKLRWRCETTRSAG